MGQQARLEVPTILQMGWHDGFAGLQVDQSSGFRVWGFRKCMEGCQPGNCLLKHCP